MPDWKAIKAEYIRGGTSYKKLCDKYGVSFSSLRNQAEKEKWTELKAKAQHKSNMKLVEKVSDEASGKNTKIIDVADKLLDKLNQVIDKIDYRKTKDLKNITAALKDLKEIKGIKSAIDLKEQEARIAKLEKEAQKDVDDKGIVVEMGGVEEYSR